MFGQQNIKISDVLLYINFGDVAACRVSVCVSYARRKRHLCAP